MARSANRKRYRIGIGGIAIESSTFSPLVSTEADFTIQRGNKITTSYPYFADGTFEGRRDIDWFPAFKARSIPGGPVAAATFAAFMHELLDRIGKSLPLDGFYFDIHGAMSVVGMDDAEGELANAIRELVGPACVISAGMDLHGNVSDTLVGAVDVFTAYREAPHIDAMETKARAVRLLLQLLDDEVRPYRAWVRIPVMLPGERTSTFWEPGKTVYQKLTESDQAPGAIDASLWVGYVWADQPRTSATAVVTGTDSGIIRTEARKIAKRYWDARRGFQFDRPSGSADWTIGQALALNQKSVIVSDSGDNPTAGGAGDVPHFAERLLANAQLGSGARTAIVAAIPAPEAVVAARAAGVGSQVSITIGGVLDPVNGAPLDVTGTVHAIMEGDHVGGDIAVIRTGGVHIIVTSRRKPYHRLQDFRNLKLDPSDHDLTVVKIGYLEPELRKAASSSFIALTPGAVNQDIPSLPFHRVRRPVFPLDPDMPDPVLDVRIFKPIA